MNDTARSVDAPPQPGDMQRSNRDLERTRVLLEQWLAAKVPTPTVSDLVAPEANGMSSETLLFDATWDGLTRRLVARVAPAASDVPVFETYELHHQFLTMREVRARTDVPVPEVFWSEPGEDAIGSAFFVMERIDGEVPPDVMPYNFGESWLFHASPEDQSRLQETSVAILPALHAIQDAPHVFAFLGDGDQALRKHVDAQARYYEWAITQGPRSPLVERMFSWLEAHWPRQEGPTVLSWGDSRIGNVMYRDFEPVAVLDWEMAALAPPEMDLAWMIFMHRAFEDMASEWGFPGMADFMKRDDVLSLYERLSGYTPRDFEFYAMCAGLRWGIVGLRTALRSIHFGEREMPDDPDDLCMTRSTLERMVAGTYWP
jgi:aminoglycoside phosphotransferase (APT) family kinase protein